MRERGVSSVVGVVLLVGVAVVGAMAVVTVAPSTPATVPTADLRLSAEAVGDRVAITHHGGETLDVSEVDIEVMVDGHPLARQPPVPFFSAAGFDSGPTGPFNSASEPTWRAGTTAAFEIASTNSHDLDPGDTVSVVVRTDAGVIDRLRATA